jgi:hypothetical protein
MRGTPAQIANHEFHFGGIAIDQWNKVFGLNLYCRETYSFMVEKFLIRDAATSSEKLLHTDMAVVQDSWIINEADGVAVGKTDSDCGGESHRNYLPAYK